MVTAWDYPKNPLADPSLDDSTLAKEIRWGYRIFTDTPGEAPAFAPGRGSCNNCHLNGGQRERACAGGDGDQKIAPVHSHGHVVS